MVSRATLVGLAGSAPLLTRENGRWRLDLALAGMPHAVERSMIYARLKQSRR